MQPQESSTEQSRDKGLKTHTVYLMIAVALFYDILSILVPTLVGVVATMHFLLWFKLHGVSFIKPKRFLSGGAGAIIELFPFTSFLPAWTITVAYIAHDAKARRKPSI